MECPSGSSFNDSLTLTTKPTTSIISKKKPALTLIKRGGTVIGSPEVNSALSGRESAFSFRQSYRSLLLFGKNNVLATDQEEDKPGYLSLLQDWDGLMILKWVPYSVIHMGLQTTPRTNFYNCLQSSIRIKMETITHIHLHQNQNSKSVCVVLIDSDGIQQFSFSFLHKENCFSFLEALENGYSPLFKLEPAIDTVKIEELFLFENQLQADESDTPKFYSLEHLQHDKTNKQNIIRRKSGLVFRVISFAAAINSATELNLQRENSSQWQTITRSSTRDFKNLDLNGDISLRDSFTSVTRAMQKQIVAKAFYGWYSYSKHIQTIRKNLANIVILENEFPLEPDGSNLPVNEVFWKICRSEKTIASYKQFLSKVYFYGIEPELRAQTWPYLLRIVEWHQDFDETSYNAFITDKYERDVTSWIEIEQESINNEKKMSNETFKESLHQNSEYTDLNFGEPSDFYSVNSEFFEELDSNQNFIKNGESAVDEKTILVKEFAINLSRIQKDVDRCDRITKFYSKKENLESLRKIMCTYVFRRLQIDLADGYVQGMCDLLAPLLVVFGDEAITLACFEQMMQRLTKNFPPQDKHANGMEETLNHFRCLVEVMDPALYWHLCRNVEYSFVVFYRWLLLDFKRELVYSEVFQLWEVIWAAEMMCSRHFSLFFGLALLIQYREILIDNQMDFTDVIKFFNEMAEKHDVKELLGIARMKLRAFQEIIQELSFIQ